MLKVIRIRRRSVLSERSCIFNVVIVAVCVYSLRFIEGYAFRLFVVNDDTLAEN